MPATISDSAFAIENGLLFSRAGTDRRKASATNTIAGPGVTATISRRLELFAWIARAIRAVRNGKLYPNDRMASRVAPTCAYKERVTNPARMSHKAGISSK